MFGQDLRVTKTKKKLHQSLITLLQDKMLAEITVTELCQEASITRRTFYLHYESIAKLFQERIQQLLNDLEISFQTSSKKRWEPKVKQLQPEMIFLFSHVYDNQSLYKIIFSSKSNFAYYELFFGQMKKLIKESANKIDRYQNISDFELSYQANAILGLIIEWCHRDFEESIDFMNRKLLTILKPYI